MKNQSTTIKALACTIFILALCSLAQAQATRTWVSGVGDDLNPCSRTAPCKTFAGAISKTFIGGEIDCLDSGGFGTVTISKSITIDGGAGFGSILASGTNGVNVNLTSANDPEKRVTLRRLSINGTGQSGAIGQSTGIRAINASSFGKLYVENCYIQNFTTVGIDVNLTATGSVVSIKDTNINNTVIGMQATTSTGFVTGMLDNVRVDNCSTGVAAKNNAFLTLRDTALLGSGSGTGVAVQAPGGSAGMNLERVMLFNWSTAFAAGIASTKADISNSNFLNNSTGVSSGGATVDSHGNNRFRGNTSDGVALNPVGQK
jgi:hypothetical protein